jgi:hypothetical protein
MVVLVENLTATMELKARFRALLGQRLLLRKAVKADIEADTLL